jgi:DNA invertase Pin-like site-specific DNA recombinase
MRGRVRSGGQPERRASLEAQRRGIAAECKRRGWQLAEVGEKAGFSAEELKHPGMQEALRLLASGEGKALVARKRERPARLLLDLAFLMASAQKQGWGLVALDCALDTTTPSGEAAVRVLASFAPCEQGLISKRIGQALAAKRAQGVRLGRPPTMSAYAFERIRRERAAGKSLAAIANGLNADRIPTAQGGRRWYPATIRYTLNRAS